MLQTASLDKSMGNGGVELNYCQLANLLAVVKAAKGGARDE